MAFNETYVYIASMKQQYLPINMRRLVTARSLLLVKETILKL